MDTLLKWNDSLLSWNRKYIRGFLTGPPPPPPPQDQLVARWPLQSNLNDTVGTNNFTLVSGSETYSPGLNGNALVFSGSNRFDCVSSALNPYFGLQNTPWSVSLWILQTGPYGGNVWGTYNNASVITLQAYTNDYTHGMVHIAGNGGQRDYDNVYNHNWRHIVWSYDQTSTPGSVYVDNVLLTNVLGQYPHWGEQGPVSFDRLKLGIDTATTGLMQFMYVYGKMLTTGEINTLYNGGMPI